MNAFTQFYRENSDVWRKKFDYKESGPHILLMAFLQRIINGGGSIHREYALGRKRLDLLIEWPVYSSQSPYKKNQRIVIELKIKRNQNTIIQGLEQTADYMDTNNATEGHLVIFDPTLNSSWDKKIFTQEHTIGKNSITVWGM